MYAFFMREFLCMPSYVAPLPVCRTFLQVTMQQQYDQLASAIDAKVRIQKRERETKGK